jgi:uncharacterized membrane protein
MATAFGERASLRQKTPLATVAHDLPDDVRMKLRQHMRGVALTVSADFSEAHADRKQAADLAGAATFDRTAIAAELDKARVAENRGRAKLEDGFLQFLQTQPQPTRVTLAKALLGRGSMRMNGPGRGGPRPDPDGPPPRGPDGGPPPPPPGL